MEKSSAPDCGQFAANSTEMIWACGTKSQLVVRSGQGNHREEITVRESMSKSLGRLLRDCKAGVAPLLALGIIPLLGSVGAAVDYTHAGAGRTSMQAALDAAALILSKEVFSNPGIQLDTKGTNYFNANFVRPDVDNIAIKVASSTDSNGTTLKLSATGSMKTSFMGVMGITKIPLSVNSGVLANADGLGCVLSLNKTVTGATTGQGTTSVNLSACSLYDNSNNASALTVGGSATISALSVGVVGGISGEDKLITSQGIRTGVGAVIDPYANDAYPAFGKCDYNAQMPTKAYETSKNVYAISQGVYCGGIKVNAGETLKLNSGIYYLDGNGFDAEGGTVTGDGVTLVFTQKNTNKGWATATINGNATVNLTPPKSGPTTGIVMFGDRAMPASTPFKLNGGSGSYLYGAVYIPSGAISFSGGAATSASCTQIIGDTVTFTGNSALAINCSGYNTKPFSPTVIKLVS
jgi:Flp pilus assembly protein TadG